MWFQQFPELDRNGGTFVGQLGESARKLFKFGALYGNIGEHVFFVEAKPSQEYRLEDVEKKYFKWKK